jgi:Cu(I)/Ag(I) efflux system membrane fusion protein
MLPEPYYFLIAAVVLALAGALALFRRTRAWLLRGLPAVAFFVLLFGTADIAYRIGTTHGGGGGAASATTYTCSMHPQVRQDGPGLCPICHMELVPLAAVSGGDGPGVTIDPVVVQNMGVRLHDVARGDLARTVRAFGALREAQTRQRDIALKFDGFVEQLFADTEGMAIAAGEPLFAVYSSELVVAQEELIAARRSGDAGLLAAARQKLLLWDVPEAEVDRLALEERAERALLWRSPAAGTLVRRDVVAGAPAPRNQVLLRIVDLSVLWLDAQVAERDLGAVTLGQDARATFPAAPALELEGKVIFVAPVLDERSRTAAVRVEVRNDDGRLRPGMFARLALQATIARDTVLVPQEAVLDSGVRQLAWIAVGKGRFEPREVQLGAAGDGGLVEIRAGLAPGDRVVASGQFLIDAESRLREATRKLQDEGLMPGGDLPVRAAVELSPATRQQIDALLAAYLEVAKDMASDRHDAAHWQALATAAAAVSAAPEPDVQREAAAVAAVLQEHPEPDLVAARVAFKTVSTTAERLFETARPAAPGSATLYVHHCPMAEADWLQLDADVRNPYYGSSMLACGAVRRELPLRAAGGGK